MVSLLTPQQLLPQPPPRQLEPLLQVQLQLPHQPARSIQPQQPYQLQAALPRQPPQPSYQLPVAPPHQPIDNYSFKRRGSKDDDEEDAIINWRCTKDGCRARCATTGDYQLVFSRLTHNHEHVSVERFAETEVRRG